MFMSTQSFRWYSLENFGIKYSLHSSMEISMPLKIYRTVLICWMLCNISASVLGLHTVRLHEVKYLFLIQASFEN